MLSVGPRLAKLVPRLASDQPGEVVATVAAIRRTLSSAGLDLHDLAADLAQPSTPSRRRSAQRDRSETPAPIHEALQRLRTALDGDLLTPWEIDFTHSVLTAAERPGWHPTAKQAGVISRLSRKIINAEGFDL